jgi:hypothetical protein
MPGLEGMPGPLRSRIVVLRVLRGTVLPAHSCCTKQLPGSVSPPWAWHCCRMLTCPDWITACPGWCVFIQSPQQMQFIRRGGTDRSRWWAGKGLCHVPPSFWWPNMIHPPAACLTDPQASSFLCVNNRWNTQATQWIPSAGSNWSCPLSYRWRRWNLAT